jgi:hypothetical protein
MKGFVLKRGTDSSIKMVIASDNPGLSKDETRVC